MKKVKNLDILIYAIIIYIEVLIIISKAHDIDRYNYQHGMQYEYKTLGDVGKNLIRKHTSWGDDFFNNIDNWLNSHSLVNEKTGGN